jgi:hypothetical protein
MVYINMSRSKIKKKNRKIKNKKIIPLNSKASNNDISRYPFVEIEWFDIEGDAGWNETTTLEAEKLPVCVSTGYLLSQKKGVTRIFSDYIKSKNKPTFENIGNTTIIPTSVIQSIRKVR